MNAKMIEHIIELCLKDVKLEVDNLGEMFDVGTTRENIETNLKIIEELKNSIHQNSIHQNP